MVYINGRFLCNRIDGISRFSLQICKQLKRQQFQFTILIPEWLDYKNDEEFKIHRSGKLKSHLWEQIDLRRFLLSNGSPLLINFSGLGLVLYKNQIITIHDLSFLVEPKWFSVSYRLFYRLMTPLIAKEAKAILTVSNFSKSEIIKFLKINEEKIYVIYNAVTGVHDADNSTHSTSDLPDKFILGVSSLDPRKNHERLIKAFDHQSLADYQLLLVGKTASNFNFNLSEISNSRIHFLGHVTDLTLHQLYKEATIFIYPSLYEGFGIPPLEAMARNCPVVASKIPSIEEVCQDTVYYVNPQNIEDIRSGMLHLIQDDELREQLRTKGIARAKDFNWSDSASRVIKIINSLLK
ncbi:MAG: glycosyltransferase family 1 protein [Bacteroidota bacterium]